MSSICYDFHCYSQQRQHQKKAKIYPVQLAMECEYYRKQGHDVFWGFLSAFADKNIVEPENLPFLSLPAPDRVFTRAKEFTSGNYKYLPGTHIMAASGCWWGKCTFCVEKGKPYEVRSVDDVIAEIKECKRLGFREVFDDSATFPVGGWLWEFCDKLRPLNMHFGCNMRFGSLKSTDYLCLKNSGFRMLLYGLESYNQRTLDKINKGVDRSQAIEELILASRYGLEPHVAVMVSYPWETKEDMMRTINLVKWLLIKGHAKTAQCSFYTPPTGQEQGKEEHRKYVKQIYKVGYSPEFWFTQLKSVRNMDDIKYIWRGIKAAIHDTSVKELLYD